MSWHALCLALARWPGPARWAWAAARDDSGEWHIEHFSVRAPAEAENVRWRYPDAAFGVEQITAHAASRRLRAGTAVTAASLGARLEFERPAGSVFASRLSTEDDRVELHRNA